jgi:hypothetical protein
MSTIKGDNAIIHSTIQKVELAIHRARSKYTNKMTAHVLAEAICLELSKIAREIEDAQSQR